MLGTSGELSRPAAAQRAEKARGSLSSCRLCTFRCGVDRTQGPTGVCRTDAIPRVFHEGIEWAGEAELVPTYVVSLSGCNLACSFCITGDSSQNGRAGVRLDPDPLGARIRAASPRIRSVTVLGGEPTIHLDGALEIAARVPRPLKLVWKTNACASPEGLEILEGIPDVVLADFKFGNDRCAERLAGITRYTETVQANLRWAAKTSRLIVRHLLMPGHHDCCLLPAMDWLARELPGIPVSLMTGFLPVFRTASDPALARTNRSQECRRALESVSGRGLPLLPWTMAPEPSRAASPPDEIWIDREGRICVDSASAELVAALKRMDREFVLKS